ncbi:hypothetical protein FXO37_07522 [Capsicum annuum]|nr:hypothetical protein FXO37_07522 [Capsicum annuum]
MRLEMLSHHSRRETSLKGKWRFTDELEVRDKKLGYASSRGSTKGNSSELQVEHSRDVRPSQVTLSSSTPIFEKLLIHLLTNFGGCSFECTYCLSISEYCTSICVKASYGVPPTSSVDPSMVPTSAYGTPQTLCVVPPFVSVFKYGILRLGVQPSSMLPAQLGSHLAKFTMSYILIGTIIYFEDLKRFR